MSYGIRIIDVTGPVRRGENWKYVVGSWVKFYNPDAFDGGGDVEFTSIDGEALKFEDPLDAWRCWRQQSTVRPLREDGLPNRPLTALSVIVEEIT